MKRILFVCMGNICRSPLAEGIARSRIKAGGVRGQGRGADPVFDSAGIESYHVGQPPDSRARALARRRGTPIDDLRARQVTAQDFSRFDLVLAADRSNLRALQALRPADASAELALLLEWAGRSEDPDVPDPYYGDESDFERVFDLLDAVMPALLRRAGFTA